MICNTRSEVPIWIKWLAIRAPKSRSESNDLQYALRSSDLNQMISDTRSEVPIWIKWLAIRAPKSDLNQMICNLRSEVPSESNYSWYAIRWERLENILNHFAKQWFITEFRKAPFPHHCFFKSLLVMLKFENEWLFWTGF